MRRLHALAALGLASAPLPVLAHGIWGHTHVTGWAIENLPDGELKEFFGDPGLFNAAIFGAAFTDSGYWVMDPVNKEPSRAYSEHTHWEPFIEDFVQWILANDPPPWTDYESKLRVAFLMGCASHGMQDEIFDSLFLHQVEVKDAGSQDNADPGTDGFLALDKWIHYDPQPYVPMDVLLELYAVLPEDVDEGIIQNAVGIMTTFYVNDDIGKEAAKSLGEEYEDELPWTRVHYMDPEVPGSLRAEIFPTMKYQEAIWKRLHGELPPGETVIFTFPDPPRRLYGLDAATPDPWVTFIYGVGVDKGSVKAQWTADAGGELPFTLKGTRWGADWTRLHRLQPQAAPEAAAWYTVAVEPGAKRIDGVVAEAAELHFQAPCEGEGDPQCPDLGPLPVATVTGEPDAGGGDAGGTDAGGTDDAGGDAAADAVEGDAGPGGDAGGDGGGPGGDTGGSAADAGAGMDGAGGGDPGGPDTAAGSPDAAAPGPDAAAGGPDAAAGGPDATAGGPDATNAAISIGHDDGCRAGGPSHAAPVAALLVVLAALRRRLQPRRSSPAKRS